MKIFKVISPLMSASAKPKLCGNGEKKQPQISSLFNIGIIFLHSFIKRENKLVDNILKSGFLLSFRNFKNWN